MLNDKRLTEIQDRYRTMSRADRQMIIAQYGSIYDWSVAIREEELIVERAKEEEIRIIKEKERNAKIEEWYSQPRELHFSYETQEEVMEWFDKYVYDGAILGSEGYLMLKVTHIDRERLDIYCEVLDNGGWQHVFIIGEETRWEHHSDHLWEEDPWCMDERTSGAQSLMYIEEEGVIMERDS